MVLSFFLTLQISLKPLSNIIFTDMKSLLGLSLSEIQDIVNQHGLPKFTAKQLTEWLYKKHTGSFDEMTNLSKATRQLLSENYTTGYRGGTRSLRSQIERQN